MPSRLVNHWNLFKILLKKDILSRYKGSVLGFFWSLLTPLLLLLVYVFVFGVVFKMKWPSANESGGDFSVVLLAGISIFFFVSEIINRSPTVIMDHSNYVKKIIFPIPLLIPVVVFSSFFNFIIYFVLLIALFVIKGGSFHFDMLMAPLIILPLVIMMLGVSFFLAAAGTYMKDLSYVAGFFSNIIMFMSPIFYPAESVPEQFEFIMNINPFTFFIEGLRSVVIFSEFPSLNSYFFYFAISFMVFLLGVSFFNKVKGGFADVL